MLRAVFAAVLCLCLADAGNAKPAATKPNVCTNPVAQVSEALQAMVARSPEYEFAIFAGDRAAKLLDAFNALPPVSHLKADQLLVVSDPDEGSALMLLATNGCVTQRLPPVTLSAWRALVKRTLGVDA